MTLPQNLYIQQSNFLGSAVACFLAGSTCLVEVYRVIRKEYEYLENRAEEIIKRFIEPEAAEKIYTRIVEESHLQVSLFKNVKTLISFYVN